MTEQEELKIRIEQLKEKKVKKLSDPGCDEKDFFDNLRDLCTLNILGERV